MADTPAFCFLESGPLVDGELTLSLSRQIPADPSRGWVAAYEFVMQAKGAAAPAGKVSFRAEPHCLLELYRGHIGYDVEPEFRGRHFAERSVRLLFPFIRRHGFPEIWITCNPDNLASRRTCERLGGLLTQVILLPESEDMYIQGDREKCRYRVPL
jgi:predicted acetyltransferase